MLQYLNGADILTSEVLPFEKLFLFEEEFDEWFALDTPVMRTLI